ncbi:cytochrome P450, partial [Trematosphaeria pertusa]
QQRSMLQGLATQMYDVHYIRSQILQGMMAFQETTAVLIANTMFLLSRHPRYWSRLRHEVRQRGEELLTFENLNNFKPLQNILSESAALRLYPIFLLMGRTSPRDTKLPVGGGPEQSQPIYVAKGTPLFTSLYTLHREESSFGPDVETFVRDWWDKIHPKQWEYFLFGEGQRVC